MALIHQKELQRRRKIRHLFFDPGGGFYDSSPSATARQSLIDTVANGCRAELEKYCSNVTPGEGRVLACLYALFEHPEQKKGSGPGGFFFSMKQKRRWGRGWRGSGFIRDLQTSKGDQP